MKDKRQRIAMAWPYAVYTDPTFAATVLQAAAASAHANGTLPDIAAIANAYQYSAAAVAAAAGPSYFHGAAGGDYGKFQPQHYVHGPLPPPLTQTIPLTSTPSHALQHQLMKKPFGPFLGHHQHHHHHHHHQFAAAIAAADSSVAETNNGHHHHVTAADSKVTAAATTADGNNKTPTISSSSSSSATDATDTAEFIGTSCKCGIVDCVLTTSGKSINNHSGSGGMSASSTPPATVDRLPPPPPSSVSFFTTSGPETGRDDLQSAECSLAVHKHVYHKEYSKNKLFQPYKSDVATAKLNL